MLPLDRTTVIGGPCAINYNGLLAYSAGDVTVTPKKSLFDISTSRWGKRTDRRLKDFYFEVSYQPSGEVTDATLALYFALYTLALGKSIFPANDQSLQIIGLEASNNRLTFCNSAMTKIPDVSLKLDSLPFGSTTFTCLGGKGKAFTDTNRIVAIDTVAYPADTYAAANVVTCPYTGSWADSVPTGATTGSGASPDIFHKAAHGYVVNDLVTQSGFANAAINGTFQIASVVDADHYTLKTLAGAAVNGNAAEEDGGTVTRANGFDAFDTEEGFAITHQMETRPRFSQSIGTFDMQLTNLSIMAKGKVRGPSMADYLAALNPQGANAALGKSMLVEGRNLNLTGNGLYYRLSKAAMEDGATIWSNERDRFDALAWGANQSFTAGVANPLAIIDNAPIA